MNKWWKQPGVLIRALSHYGISVDPGSHICCPFPQHTDERPSFWVNPEGNFFKCWSCGRYGDAVNAIQHLQGWKFGPARKLLKEILHGKPPKQTFQIHTRYRSNQEALKLREIAVREWWECFLDISDDRSYKEVEQEASTFYVSTIPDRLYYWVDDLVRELASMEDAASWLPAYSKFIQLEFNAFVGETVSDDFSIDACYKQLASYRPKIRATDNPYSVGPPAITEQQSAVANVLNGLSAIKQQVIRRKANTQRKLAIVERFINRKMFVELSEHFGRYKQYKTKEERKQAVEVTLQSELDQKDTLQGDLVDLDGLLDYIDSMRSDIRQILSVAKVQLESHWRDNAGGNVPVSGNLNEWSK